MTFREYIHLLAESIGLHQVPVIELATEIRYFLAEDAVHHKFVTCLVRDIYKKNSCGHLDATIEPATTLSFLHITRTRLLADDGVDICKIRLINQICGASTMILDKQNKPGQDSHRVEAGITKESIQ